ncbi:MULTISPECIES: Ada metal-binding domain-containing protein [unclassified Flavobacterium]|jgi:methylphosphotriester-DNA--protein-cysteine methyltransferase|uniref:Ada metal-binding domain-containing protein n=1 Tax=unclassified Flavobacterium TaxID=196869 RepID=UPI00352DD7F8
MNPQQTINDNRIAAAIDYIIQNFKDKLNRDEVAAIVHLSPFHFQGLFSEWAGNSNLKIQGTSRFKSGKRLKKENRVFFTSEAEAIQNNFRPCGHCMKTAYKQWIYSAPD